LAGSAHRITGRRPPVRPIVTMDGHVPEFGMCIVVVAEIETGGSFSALLWVMLSNFD
jgi:hypothetical protein